MGFGPEYCSRHEDGHKSSAEIKLPLTSKALHAHPPLHQRPLALPQGSILPLSDSVTTEISLRCSNGKWMKESLEDIDFLELRDFNIISNQFSDIETPGPQQPSFCFEIIAPWVSGSPPGTRESLRPGTGMLIPRMESNVFEVFEAGSAALT